MPQNVMIGTVDGEIYYVRTGRVPVRNHNHPTDRPVPGNDSKNDYAGIHPFEDLVQIENPPQGYMQNCNISPEWLMKESSLLPASYRDSFYLYNHEPGPAHQRAQMVLHLLADDESVNTEEAIEIAFSTQVWGAEAWQDRITKAWQKLPADLKSGDAKTLFEEITAWNRKSTPDSVGALHFYMFKQALGDKKFSEAVEVPDDLSDETIGAALTTAAQRIRETFDKLDVAYGDYFRVGREGGDKTYPVGGGSVKESGMATPRAISFGSGEKQRVGHGGQTSTQVVVLTRPPKSYMVLPLGESDHKESGHWDDQAEKLFGPGKAKDTFFLNREGLMSEVTATTELDWSGVQ
jgi:acyl-homoserine lactone acylase PvdQ